MHGLEMIADAEDEMRVARRIPRMAAAAQVGWKPEVQAFEHRGLAGRASARLYGETAKTEN